MDLFLAISQGIGLALATGVRPFLPPIAAGALARADVGVDFSGTDFAFLESIPFLAAMVGVTALAAFANRGTARRPVVLAFVALAIALGALEFAGVLQDEGYAGGAGLAAGAVLAALGVAAAATFIGGAQSRLAARNEQETASFLTLFADGAMLAAAVLAVLLPPASYLLLAFALWVLVERRRRAARKYEGLRVLR